MFEGLYTALVTPFKEGKIDYDALNKIVELQIKGGVDGIVPMGTTGESPTVSFDEHKNIIKHVVDLVKKRVKVIAGTGANSTDEAIYLTKSAEDNGVDAVLLVTPYYNKPPQRGLIAHFENIARSVSIPIILYNIPGRTAINLQPESIKELLNRVDNIVALKDATGDIPQMMKVIELCGDRLTLLSGDDILLLPVLSIGGKGVISVISNILPAEVKNIISLFNNGNYQKAKEAFYKLLPLSRAMFLEVNPIPIKSAMNLMGYCSSDIRFPLVTLNDENLTLLKKTMTDYGLKL